jgi:hypothetical protein
LNREDIIRMAQEQGLPETDTEGVFIVNTDDLGRMLSAEREACAQMLEAASKTGKIISCTSAAKAIRARGQA